MKKLLACILAFVLCLSLAACAQDEPAPTPDPDPDPVVDTPVEPVVTKSDVENARDYISAMYKKDAAETAADYQVVAQVIINGTTFPIEWVANVTTGAAEDVKVEEPVDNMVTINVNEQAPEEVIYDLVATVKDADGKTESVTFPHTVPAAPADDLCEAEILARAFALEPGATMLGKQVLRGEIVSIDSAYSAEYNNITVTIQVGEQTIQCYRLAGGEDLVVGDVITVTGEIKNYNGTVEFDAKCTYSKDMSTDEAKQLITMEKAYALEAGATMLGKQALRGEIVSIDSAYSAEYNNITVTIQVGEQTIQCYRLAGGEDLVVGDVITVTGEITNYNGTIEFAAKCTYSKDQTLAEAKDIILLEKAYALEVGATMLGKQEITGEIISIDSAYSAEYNNITVTLQVGEQTIQCYRLAGGEELAVGDVITVTGDITNYNGTIEFAAKCTYVK